jgi:Zn-dependent peptidase ImmA (M78 family)
MSAASLAGRFGKLEAWERGEIRPTLKQLEAFAKATFTPVGYLFLQAPPVEEVPIPDLRTMDRVNVRHPSPDLLETLYICQQRQEWYRDFVRSMGEDRLGFVGSLRADADVEAAADAIREALGFDLEERHRLPTWTEALRRFIVQAEKAGILVMVSGVVLNNNRRHLDPGEFRGFAIADELAPLVFVNGADTKAAQMFTLAHEVAHIWLGQSALSDPQARSIPHHHVERWCNCVAAELLVPLAAFRAEYRPDSRLREEMDCLARRFKVSTLVILRRIFDVGAITKEELWAAYDLEVKRLRLIPKSSGGDFYLTQAARVSRRFARALVTSTLEGQTLHRDAFQMLGISKLSTFQEIGRNLGVIN